MLTRLALPNPFAPARDGVGPPPTRGSGARVVRTAVPYVCGAAVCLLALAIHLELWRADPRAPFRNEGDAIFSQLFVKNVLDTGWYATNPRCGAPYGLELYDFPMSEGLHFVFIRAIGLFTRNVYRVVNCFFLLSFVLSTLTAMFTFRWLGVRALPGLVGGVLFAFLPYHFYRSEWHLFLAAYYMIPLAVLVTIWLAGGQLGAAAADDPWRRRRAVTAALVAAGLSSTGAYYAYFGCFFFAVGGLAGFCRTYRVRVLAAAAALVGVVVAGFAANVASAVRYTREHGPNPHVAKRIPIEAEVYSLSITQLLMPRLEHRAEAVRRIKQDFITTPGRPIPGDYGSAVGAVGLVGLIAAVGAALFRRQGAGGSGMLADLGTLAVCGTLLGTACGLGSLVAYFVTPKIRCYDRVSIYIGFCAVAGVVVLLDRLLAGLPPGWRQRAGQACCLGVLGFGLWDQTSATDVPDYEARRDEYRKTTRFVAAMEAAVPPGGMVFQLPYIDFPETAALANMTVYDHLRLLMPSHSLRFSHGRCRGRSGDSTLASAAGLPVERMVDYLSYMGFAGIHVDRFGYPDGGAAVVTRLQALLGPPLASETGRDLFFPLVGYRERLLVGQTPDQIAALETRTRYPFRITWEQPFDGEERSPQTRWRWCRGPVAEAVFDNPGREPVHLAVTFKTGAPLREPVSVTLSGVVDDTFPLVNGEAVRTVRFCVPPGRHRLRFECPTRPLKTPGRDIYFGIFDFKVRVENDHPLLERVIGAGGWDY